MSLYYLLDTNVISEPLKPIYNNSVINQLSIHKNKVALPSLVVYELLRGCYKLQPSKKRNLVWNYIQDLMSNTPILFYDKKAAEWHSQEQARLESIGKPAALIDGQIAAIAKVNKLILITRNTIDFENFEGLQMENWFEV